MMSIIVHPLLYFLLSALVRGGLWWLNALLDSFCGGQRKCWAGGYPFIEVDIFDISESKSRMRLTLRGGRSAVAQL